METNGDAKWKKMETIIKSGTVLVASFQRASSRAN